MLYNPELTVVRDKYSRFRQIKTLICLGYCRNDHCLRERGYWAPPPRGFYSKQVQNGREEKIVCIVISDSGQQFPTKKKKLLTFSAIISTPRAIF